MKELLTSILETLGLAWWVEIITENPSCTYYFGPFASESDAKVAKVGYIEDLEQEGAHDMKVIIKRCKPGDLTVYDEGADLGSVSKSAPAFSN